MKPVIGITLDHEKQGGYSDYCDWYAIRTNYVDVIAKAGGVPILLPYHKEHLDEYMQMIDGLILIGGDFDIDPAKFGEEIAHQRVQLKSHRTEFEWALLERAFAADMPILGICAGEQLLNVFLGGSLIQHIPAEQAIIDYCKQKGIAPIKHEQKPVPATQATHDIEIVEGTLLHQLLNCKTMKVNTTHHQAVKEPGKGVIVSATAPDSVIEAIEVPEKTFCMGLEWHPEYLINKQEQEIFNGLVRAAGKKCQKKHQTNKKSA